MLSLIKNCINLWKWDRHRQGGRWENFRWLLFRNCVRTLDYHNKSSRTNVRQESEWSRSYANDPIVVYWLNSEKVLPSTNGRHRRNAEELTLNQSKVLLLHLDRPCRSIQSSDRKIKTSKIIILMKSSNIIDVEATSRKSKAKAKEKTSTCLCFLLPVYRCRHNLQDTSHGTASEQYWLCLSLSLSAFLWFFPLVFTLLPDWIFLRARAHRFSIGSFLAHTATWNRIEVVVVVEV